MPHTSMNSSRTTTNIRRTMLSLYTTFCLLATTAVIGANAEIVYEEADRSTSECVSQKTVCADISTFNKTVNGKRQATERRVNNCVCPGGVQCPRSEEHMIYDTKKHRMVMCQRVADLRKCTTGQTAEEIHMKDPMFSLFSYTNVNCLCPAHEDPLPGIFARSVVYQKQEFHVNHLMRRYTCNTGA